MCQRTWLSLLFVASFLLAGCASEVPTAPPPRSPEVLVSLPVQREVVDYEIFTGRTEASTRVELRSRVTGYLDRTYFQEGDLVKKDDLLFIIDPRPFRAELAKAEASLASSQTHARRLETDFERAQVLFGRQAIGREEFDKLRCDRDEARAACRVAESNVELARLNLQYTEVRAPCTGRISRRLVDPGNLVKADETILTVLVAEEPMYAYFDVDERTLLRQMMREGQLEATLNDRVAVSIGLADEEGFPHTALVNFVDNRVDPGTGSMWLRAQFVNPHRPIKAGLFVRVRFPLGQPYRAILVSEQALGTDQGQKFLYVVDADGKVEYRQVTPGRLQEDGMRIIQAGLKPDERVIVSGLQRVRAGAVVMTKQVDMPRTAVARGKTADPEGEVPHRPRAIASTKTAG
jgi:RND family efflux transporter MFP subunit